MILGLDLALHTGYALSVNNRIVKSGVWDFTESRSHNDGHNGHVFFDLIKSIEDNFGSEGYEHDFLIRVERAHHRGGPATRLALGMYGAVQLLCAECNIGFEDVHTGTLKKWATGNGKALKKDMMLRASQLAKRKVTDNDEADAILVALYSPEKK